LRSFPNARAFLHLAAFRHGLLLQANASSQRSTTMEISTWKFGKYASIATSTLRRREPHRNSAERRRERTGRTTDMGRRQGEPDDTADHGRRQHDHPRRPRRAADTASVSSGRSERRKGGRDGRRSVVAEATPIGLRRPSSQNTPRPPAWSGRPHFPPVSGTEGPPCADARGRSRVESRAPAVVTGRA
jgi:hypothetical protein